MVRMVNGYQRLECSDESFPENDPYSRERGSAMFFVV